MRTLQEVNHLTQAQVDSLVNYEQAIACYNTYPFTKPGDILVDYQPPYDWICEPTLGTVSVLITLPITRFKPGELEWDWALKHWTTRLYIQWYRQGYLPPPLFVVQHKDGSLVSCNRRRWLAAREAGIAELPVWYSPSTDTGMPLWEHRLCMMNNTIVCTRKQEGKSCVGCEHF